MKLHRSFYLLFLTCLVPILGSAQDNSDIKLWYNKPASNWNEALPLGNGRLAAMVFGVPAVEHLQLNEETIWAGSPNNNANPNAKDALPIVRKLVFEGKYFEAESMATEKIMSKTNSGMPYQTMGDLYVSFPGHSNYTDYYRDLNLNTAIATTSYKVDRVKYTREIFTSFTDQTVIVRLTADKPESINCNVLLTSPHESYDKYSENGTIILSGLTENYEGQKGKVKFQTRVKAKTNGGLCVAKDGLITIEKATDVTLYISIATNFKNYKELTVDQEAKCEDFLSKAIAKDYESAKKDHVVYFKKFMDRVTLNLGQTDSVKKPIDIRIKEFSKGFDPQLATTYFQYGRYLLICSSQPGCQPANLQGKWCDKLFPSWDSKYTVNINTEMNYWPAEVTNLSEFHEPLIQLVKEVAESGAQTAQIMYGAHGWVLHHNTDIWRVTGGIDKAPSGMWPLGGAWLCQHLWQRYLYTGNKEYLASVYPIMKGAARFFLDFLIEEPSHKWLVICPSNSPENPHMGSEPKATTAAGCTLDNQLLFDLFSNVIRASDVLSADRGFADTIKLTRNRLAPMQIGQYSQLQEWMQDWDDPKDTHRHVSHLYGVFPSNQISPYKTPELFDAARTSLIYRGDPSTGWSMGWKVCLWARFLDGDHAYKLLTDQLSLVTPAKKSGGTYSNMLDAHPPFQIDGNFGCTAGLAEMFMQSQDGFIFILPALPGIWKTGSINGLMARGGFEISISWKDGKLEKLTVYSKIGGNCRLRTQTPLKAEKGTIQKAAKGDNPNPLFVTPEIKTPVISEKAKLNPVVLPKTQVYDVATEAGKTYIFYGL
jgi:alpha-L-fucosidase 2